MSHYLTSSFKSLQRKGNIESLQTNSPMTKNIFLYIFLLLGTCHGISIAQHTNTIAVEPTIKVFKAGRNVLQANIGANQYEQSWDEIVFERGAIIDATTNALSEVVFRSKKITFKRCQFLGNGKDATEKGVAGTSYTSSASAGKIAKNGTDGSPGQSGTDATNFKFIADEVVISAMVAGILMGGDGSKGGDGGQAQSGANASCSSYRKGGDGGNGGDGGDSGNGGNGGNFIIEYKTINDYTSSDIQILAFKGKGAAASIGGKGGLAGRAKNCVFSKRDGGVAGLDGQQGKKGQDGQEGKVELLKQSTTESDTSDISDAILEEEATNVEDNNKGTETNQQGAILPDEIINDTTATATNTAGSTEEPISPGVTVFVDPSPNNLPPTSKVTAEQFVLKGTIRGSDTNYNTVLFNSIQAGKFYPGEELSIDLTGQVNLCPSTRTEERGGFLGIGAKNVKTVTNNFFTPNYRKPLMKWSDGTPITAEEIRSGKLIVPPNGAFNEPLELEAYIPRTGISNCNGVGTGNYTLAIIVNNAGRKNALKDKIALANPLNINTLTSFLDRRLQQAFPGEIGNIVSAGIEQNALTDKTALQEYVIHFFGISDPTILKTIADGYIEDGVFNKAKGIIRDKIIQLEKEANNSNNSKAALAAAYEQLGDVLFKDSLGIEEASINNSIFAYTKSTNHYEELSQPNKQIRAALKSVNMLQKIRTQSSLDKAIGALEALSEQFKGGAIPDDETPKDAIVFASQQFSANRGSDQYILDRPDTEVIFDTGAIMNADAKNLSAVTITCKRLVFKENVTFNGSGDDGRDGVDARHLTGRNGRGNGSRGLPGEHGKAGTNGCTFTFIAEEVTIVGNILGDLSGGNGGDGGNGGKGEGGRNAKCRNNSGYPGGDGGIGGSGGIGGNSGNFIIKANSIKAGSNSIRLKLDGGKGGARGTGGSGGPGGESDNCGFGIVRGGGTGGKSGPNGGPGKDGLHGIVSP